MAAYKEVSFEKFMDCIFTIGYSKKFDKDFEVVKGIFAKGVENLTHADRIRLLTVYVPGKHETGKIEGIVSYDSSATACKFCQKMRKAAELQPLHICGGCYDYAQENSFKGVNIRNRHALNMIIMSSIEFTEDELFIVNVGKINRVNSSGDTPNKTYAKNMLLLAKINDHVKFAYWAKNTAAVIAACEEVGKPENVTLVQSSCIIGKEVKLAKYFDYVFTVYLTEKDVKMAVAAGAGECNGKKCAACGYKCYLNGWNKGQNIAELLRVTKAEKERLIAYTETLTA